jgi:hypothetical protein
MDSFSKEWRVQQRLLPYKARFRIQISPWRLASWFHKVGLCFSILKLCFLKVIFVLCAFFNGTQIRSCV